MSDEKTKEGMVLYEEAAVERIPNAQNLRAIATDLLNSGLYPQVKTASGAIAIIATGAEIGLGPTASLQYMAIVNGRICMESKVMLALFQRSGGKAKIIERSKVAARIEFSKPGWEPYVHEYTMEMAKTEQLSGKSGWVKMPETMLLQRCISGGIKAYDPGVIMGIAMSVEEAEDHPEGFPEEKSESNAGKGPETTAAAKRGPGRPKAEKPAQVAAPPAEKPATAKTEAPVPQKEEVLDAQVVPPEGTSGFEEPPAEEDDPLKSTSANQTKTEEDEIIEKIKTGLQIGSVDEKKFKEWLEGYQSKMKPPRKFVIRWPNKALRFHGGDLEDLKYLMGLLVAAIKIYQKQTEKKEEE